MSWVLVLTGQVGDQLVQQQAGNAMLSELLAHTQGQDVPNLGAGPEAVGQQAAVLLGQLSKLLRLCHYRL